MRIFLRILKITMTILLILVLLILLLIAGVFISYKVWVGKAPPIPEEPVIHAHNDLNAEGTFYESQEKLIEAMGVGWNAGNTMDMPMGARIYSQPILQPELFVKIKELGFDTVRLPVTWRHYVSGAPEYKIQPQRLARVKQVVDQALEAGLIVIINSHHDNRMYTPTQENAQNAVDFVGSLWSQIAQEFKDYDNNLIFEPMNEPKIDGSEHEWGYDHDCDECRQKAEITNRCNQAFVSAVRAAGGRNVNRYLLVTVCAPVPENAVKILKKLPEDTAEKRLMVSVHAYSPFDLAMGGNMEINKLSLQAKWDLRMCFDSLYDSFVKKGIHVVFTETGITNKNNPETRYEWAEYFISETKKRKIACVVWDNGNTKPGVEAYGIVSKKSGKVFKDSQSYYQGLMDGIKKEEE